MQKDRISIVIPAYNVGNYMHKCLASIQNQTYKDFEAIIVVDGATDDTGKIAEEYSRSDSRFQVRYQKNAGPSAAKNNALEYVTGEYLTFVDSDDYLSPEHLEKLYQSIQNCDLAVCGVVKESEESSEFSDIAETTMTRSELLNHMVVSENEIGGYCCNKLYRTRIVQEHQIRFMTGQKYMFEDLLLNYEYIKEIETGTCRNDFTYHYVMHSDEGMSRDLQNVESKWMHYTDTLDYILEHPIPNEESFFEKIKMARVWHSATAIRVLAHYKLKKTETYKKFRKVLKNDLSGFLKCSVLPLKKRAGALLTCYFPELSFRLWNHTRR